VVTCCLRVQAREFEGNPLELSYFLLSNLPVNDNARQQLLEASTVDERLRAECRVLQTLGVLCCRACRTFLARSTDAIQMSEEGISACFVNSHSWVHDIVTLSTVSKLGWWAARPYRHACEHSSRMLCLEIL
jgi:cereblon